MTRFSFSCTLLLLLVSALDAVVSVVVGDDDALDKHAQELVVWLRQNDGYFNSKLEIRREDPEDPASEFGVFATNTIKPEEQLMEIPAKLILQATDDDDKFAIPSGNDVAYIDRDRFEGLCDLTRTLIAEMRLEGASNFAPYVKYLLEKGQEHIPAMWSEPAKEILRRLTGQGGHDWPRGAADWFWDFEHTKCIHNDDELEKMALSFISSRGWGTNYTVLVPVLDIINHSNNGKLRNTEITSAIVEGTPVHVRALKKIQAGEQLFISYNDCVNCKKNEQDLILFRTPEIFRDYGFVESYPQRWGFFGGVSLLIEEVEGVDGKITLEAKHLGWQTDDWLEFMTNKMVNLQDMLYDAEMLAARDSIPPKEWETLFLYHSAMMKALSSAVKSSNIAPNEAEFRCLAEDSCSAEFSPWLRYRDLDNPFPIDLFNEHYQIIYQCETLAIDDTIVHVATVQSHYQFISYRVYPKTNDMCFYLDGTWQICTSYRPQYHEMGVHETIRYLPNEPKRILWVGGGDAMFLQEILKYPSLELAVGLELDQKVVRGAFKYFGTQPHWDNEKVQWWFGDAAKSLLMLPEDYFGSFDVVLVDLSDTLLSLSVTKEMDIIGALSLLLRPDGVFAMNELAFGKITDVFEHTLQIQHHDVPKVCTQNFVVASHAIDLLDRNLTDHNIDNLYVKPLDPSSDRFELVHDYRRNPDSKYKKLCKDHEDENGELLIQEGSSPGIFMAVEVEEVTLDLHSLKDLQIAITETLEQAGFKVESTAMRKGASGPSENYSGETVVLLREGYVAIRTWPEHKYCAFDIHLWSSFEKHEAAKKAVIAGVGGKIETTSSYRIVAGGMYGVETWKDDAKVHGPQIKNLCDRSAPTVRDVPTDQRTMEIALETGLRLIRDEKDFVAAVLCGNEEACPTIDLLKKNEKVGEVMPFYPCSNVTSNDQYSEDGRRRVIECERVISNNLLDSLSDNKRLRVIVVDKSAPRLFLQMVLRILTKDWNRWQIIDPDNIMVMAMIEDETEGWRRTFLDKVRKDVIMVDPLFRAEVMFNSSSSSMELGIVSSGDADFMLHLVDLVADVENESGLALEIREMFGGLWRPEPKMMMADEEAEAVYSQESYDRTLALQQWQSQQPVGHQTLFQLETRPLQVGDTVRVYYREASFNGLDFVGEITSIHNDDAFDIKFTYSDLLDYPSSFTKVGEEMFASKVERDEIRKLYGSPNDELLSAAKVKSALQYALEVSGESSVFSASEEIQELEVEGDGCVFVTFCLGGSVIVMWDGRMHVDVNLFTFIESGNEHHDFEDDMETKLRSVETILKDEQPRGFGRVVNHVWDLGKKQCFNPHWA